MPPGLGEELQALRQMRLSAEQRRRRVLVSFWGFGGRAARDSWLRSLCCALRTEDVYCSDVAAGRFEGVVGVFRRQGVVVGVMTPIATISTLSRTLMP